MTVNAKKKNMTMVSKSGVKQRDSNVIRGQ